jgi:hypothetical protein
MVKWRPTNQLARAKKVIDNESSSGRHLPVCLLLLAETAAGGAIEYSTFCVRLVPSNINQERHTALPVAILSGFEKLL